LLLHEFGHALGFLHDTTNPTAVMYMGISGWGENSIRNLSRDDQIGLQDTRTPYGTIRTTSLHRFASTGNLGAWYTEGEPITDFLFGSPSVDHSTQFTSAFYAVAYARALDRAVMFGRTTGSGGTFQRVNISATTQRPPTVVGEAGLSREVIAYVDDTQAAAIRYQTTKGPHGLPVGDGSGGESVMPPQQRKIIAMRA
jgi:hypothetical protein